jgi:hypothetical protein
MDALADAANKAAAQIAEVNFVSISRSTRQPRRFVQRSTSMLPSFLVF